MFGKFTFSHIADAFIQSDLHEDNGSNQNQQKSNDTQVLLQVLFSLMLYITSFLLFYNKQK